MHAFSCERCGQLIFFHNSACLRCGAPLAFDPDALRMVVADDGQRRCAASRTAACNWLAATPGELCASCRLTRTRPADGDAAALAAFAEAEAHKRRLLFNLRSLGLDLEPRDEATGTGVAFDLLASDHTPVTTGHAGGVITLDLAESDTVHREQVRARMREPYRTVLGHFRHEIGHHLFTVLVHDDDLPEVRDRFGDQTPDYHAALDRHYADGPPLDWATDHVSEYATMHPAEDWAETFAHYLHIRATLETAAAYRLRVDGPEEAVGAAYVADPVA
ncbi:MAG: putative zinc-binding metallopeptidase, partial [Nitriliruptor sp.]